MSPPFELAASFHLFDDAVHRPHTHLTITGALHYTHTGASTLASYLDIFPPTLLEASPVVLNVYVDNAMRYGHTSLDFTKLNHFLASFATCLDRRGSSHTSFQTLQLHFFTHRVGASDPIFHDILYPIAKIPTGTTLVLKGLEAKLQGRLLELRSGDVAGRDTLGGWLRLRSELMANGETGWKAKFGVASVDLMVGGGGGKTVLKEGNDGTLAHALGVVGVRRKMAGVGLKGEGGR